MSNRQSSTTGVGRFSHHSKNLKDAMGDDLLDAMEKTGKVPSREKFRRMICFTMVSTGFCPYGDRCVFLHDPRLAIAGFKMKPARNAKTMIAVKDTFYWPDMARADVSAVLDAQGLPNANQPYHIPATFRRALAAGSPGHHLVKTQTGPKTGGKAHAQSPATAASAASAAAAGKEGSSRHDRALFSLWGHFVAACLPTTVRATGATGATGPANNVGAKTIGRVPTLSLPLLDGGDTDDDGHTYHAPPTAPGIAPAWGRGDSAACRLDSSLSPLVAPFVPSPVSVARLGLSPEPSPRQPPPGQPCPPTAPTTSVRPRAAAEAPVGRNELLEGGRRLSVFVALGRGCSLAPPGTTSTAHPSPAAAELPPAVLPPALAPALAPAWQKVPAPTPGPVSRTPMPPPSPAPAPAPAPTPMPSLAPAPLTFPVLTSSAFPPPPRSAPVAVTSYANDEEDEEDVDDLFGAMLFNDNPFVTPVGAGGPPKTWGSCDAWGRPFCPPPPPLSEVCARAPTPALAPYLLQQQALALAQAQAQAQAQVHSQAQRQWQKWHQGDHGAGAIGPPPTARPGKGASAPTSWAAWEEGGGEEKGAESDVPPLLRGLALPVAAANGTYTLWG